MSEPDEQTASFNLGMPFCPAPQRSLRRGPDGQLLKPPVRPTITPVKRRQLGWANPLLDD